MDSGGHSGGLLDNDLIEYYQLLADKGDVQAQVIQFGTARKLQEKQSYLDGRNVVYNAMQSLI